MPTARRPGGPGVTVTGSSSPPSHSINRAGSPPTSTQEMPTGSTLWLDAAARVEVLCDEPFDEEGERRLGESGLQACGAPAQLAPVRQPPQPGRDRKAQPLRELVQTVGR